MPEIEEMLTIEPPPAATTPEKSLPSPEGKRVGESFETRIGGELREWTVTHVE